MRLAWRLGPLLGVNVVVHASWLVVFVLIVVALEALGVFPAELSAVLRWLLASGVGLLFFASIVAHEMGHAIAARRAGVDVREVGLAVIGTQGQLEARAGTPRGEVAIALAGPLVSLLVGGLLLAAWWPLAGATDMASTLVAEVAWLLGMSNLLLGGLNLLPGLPFDGGRVVRGLLWARGGSFMEASRRASVAGRLLAYLLIGVGLLWAASGEVLNGAWLALIGWFLAQAARMHHRRLEFGRLVEGLSVGDVMEHDFAVVGPNLTLDTLLERDEMDESGGVYPVTESGTLIGTLDLSRARRIPRRRWQTLRVGEVMTSADRLPALTALSSVMEALMFFDRTRANALPVIDGPATRRLVGMLTRDGLIRVLRSRQAARAAYAAE